MSGGGAVEAGTDRLRFDTAAEGFDEVMGEPPQRRTTTMLGFARMNFAGVRAEQGRYAEAAAARQGLPLLAAIGCGCG